MDASPRGSVTGTAPGAPATIVSVESAMLEPSAAPLEKSLASSFMGPGPLLPELVRNRSHWAEARQPGSDAKGGAHRTADAATRARATDERVGMVGCLPHRS